MGLFGAIVKVQDWTLANVLRVGVCTDSPENLLQYMLFPNSHRRNPDSFNNEAYHEDRSRPSAVLDTLRVISAHLRKH